MTQFKARRRPAVIVAIGFSLICCLALQRVTIDYGAPCRASIDLGRSYPGQRTNASTAFFVQATNTYGRYSNMRLALVKSAGIARYLNRTLIYAPFGNCLDDETVADVLDLSLLDARPMMGDLKPICRPYMPETGYAYVASMLMQYPCPSTPHECLEPAAVVGLPLPESVFAGGFMWQSKYPEQQTWTLKGMSEQSRRTRHCIGVQGAFYLNFDTTEALAFTTHQEDVERLLLPSKAIRDEVVAFLERHDLVSRPFAAMHLRLTDIGAKQFARGLDCSIDVYAFIAKTQSYGDMPVMLATDDEQSNCTKFVVKSLKATIVKSNIWHPRSCMEAAFVQEVMGHATAFVGVGNSSFSYAIESIRRLRNNKSIAGRMFSV